ncbi:3327_t:CDS:2, partial [Gigaspora margarita]
MKKEGLDESDQEMLVEDERASNACFYQNAISLKRNKMFNGYSEPVKCNDSDDPSGLYCQNDKKDKNEVSKDYEKPTELSFDNEAEGLEICNKNNKHKAPALE